MAQYAGGFNDGYSSEIYQPVLLIYSGGNSDGATHTSLLISGVYVFGGGSDEGSSNANLLIPSVYVFGGGSDEGSSNTNLLIPQVYVYGGGSDEGSSSTNLLIPQVYVFGGGSDEGSSNTNLLLPSVYVFGGGSDEGSSNTNLLLPSIYVYGGGSDEGSSHTNLLIPGIYVYGGGGDDGSSSTNLLVPIIFVFAGGNDDGSAFYTWSNTGSSTYPIELISFTAHPNDDKVDLNWKTVSEINNDYFTIEKSNNAQDWVFVLSMTGAGNSNAFLDYNAVDFSPYMGVSYYRLKQTDFDGKFTYSEIRKVLFTTNTSLVLYPNPANERIIIEADKDELNEIHIFNVLGQDVSSQVHINYLLENKVEIDLKLLSTGLYNVKTRTIVSRVIKKRD